MKLETPMKDLKLELFNFSKSLDIDQQEIRSVIEAHISAYEQLSEIQVYESLKDKLDIYRYDQSVNVLLENFGNEISQDQLKYELKDLYRKVESMNQGEVYRHPLKVILDILTENDEYEMKARILNELTVYDFVHPIKSFLFKFSQNPVDKANYSSEGGKAEKVYTVVEQVDGGHLAYVKDKWFYINEAEVAPTTLDRWFTDVEKLKSLNRLAHAVDVAEVGEEGIEFEIEDNLTIGFDVDNGKIFLNGESVEAETTLESIFQSPIIPYLRKNQFYPIIKECYDNLNNFMELDLAMKVSNIINPFMEAYVFNYKDNIYAYTVDRRYGNSFYKYESAVQIVNEMQNELGYDLTYFFEDKFNDEVIAKKKLEDREKIVLESVEEIRFNIDRLDASGQLHLPELQAAKEELVQECKKMENELNAIRRLKSETTIKEQV